PMATSSLNATWRGDQEWRLPELGGRFHFEYVRGRGIRVDAMRGQVQARLREGGEKFRPDPRRPRRSLKKLLQDQGIAPWERDRLPLLYCNEELAFVPGVGVCSSLQAAPDEAGLEVRWQLDLAQQ
ncbi:MAG TPA: tRNA lysidine(34) synthetase TilS, partial [Burkholderiales bacterium]|nr:tRNA lysidine(34) synthetase TilS [Burkholderiales bacterium]